MAVRKEMVLYYTPEKSAEDQKLKGVLVRLGIRIRNITPEQAGQKVGYLAGLPGFEEMPEQEEGDTGENREEEASVIPEKNAGALRLRTEEAGRDAEPVPEGEDTAHSHEGSIDRA